MRIKLYKLVIILGTLVIMTGISYHGLSEFEAASLRDGMRVARVAVDIADIKAVERYLDERMPPTLIAQTHEYQEVVRLLGKLQEAFPRSAQWLYIFRANPGGAEMVVLTIPANHKDSSSLPGYLYPVSSYPAMQDALSGKDIVVSKIVRDDVYQIWTRSCFAQLKDDKGETIAVLGVDITASQIAKRLLTTVLALVAYSALTVFILMSAYFSSPKKCRGQK